MALEPSAHHDPGVLYITNLEELEAFGDDWDRLSARSQTYFPSFTDARQALAQCEFLAALDRKENIVSGIACFTHQQSRDQFAVGERGLFSIAARETRLFGGNLIGGFGEDELQGVLRRALAEWSCDLFTIGEVDFQSPLVQAARSLSGLMRIRRTRKDPIRWLISLPQSFDNYLRSLRPSTRKSISYATRHFERECDFTHQVIDAPDDVSDFLCEAESISRNTYQWDVGDRLLDDQATRARYRSLAAQGRFRGYLLRVGGRPCAFAYGEISAGTFLYKTPGFDRKWRRYSPGLVLLSLTIRDVIEHTNCERFDFGLGGDTEGYKARFGTVAIPSLSLEFASMVRPRGVGLGLAHRALSFAKTMAAGLIRKEGMQRRMRQAVRRHKADAESPR